MYNVRGLPATPREYHNPQAPRKYSVKGYFRYVDDILLAYVDDPKNDIHSLLNEFNSLTPKLRFTLEEEQGNHIHFLGTTITKMMWVLLWR